MQSCFVPRAAEPPLLHPTRSRAVLNRHTIPIAFNHSNFLPRNVSVAPIQPSHAPFSPTTLLLTAQHDSHCTHMATETFYGGPSGRRALHFQRDGTG